MKNLMRSDDEFRFNEILFENRNKKYGAYALRMGESDLLKKSLLIGVAFFACISLSSLVANSFRATVIENPAPPIIELVPFDKIPEKAPEIIKKVIPLVKEESTVKKELPTPVRNPPVETPATSIKETENVRIGTENVIGTPPTTIAPPTVNIVKVPVIMPPKVVNNNPVAKVDVEANYIDGINIFRNKVVQNFETEQFEGTGDVIKTSISFIVEKDGTISGIKATGPNAQFNKEAEKTIKNVKGKWLPAKLKGENVRSYFNFPISMQFQ